MFFARICEISLHEDKTLFFSPENVNILFLVIYSHFHSFNANPYLSISRKTSNVTPVFLFDFWQWNCRFMAFRQHSALPHVASVITRRNPFRLWKHYISESVNQTVALARNGALFRLLLELYQEWKKAFPQKEMEM